MKNQNEISLFNNAQSFVVKNNNGYISIPKNTSLPIKSENDYCEKSKGDPIMGILGLLEGKNSNYLMVIKNVTSVGLIHRSYVYKITEIKLINFSGDGSLKSDEDKNYGKMIDDHVLRNSLYFSKGYDLTNSIYKMFSRTPNNKTFPFANVNTHFCWNYTLGKVYDVPLLNSILIPIINGNVGISVVPYSTTSSNKTKDFSFVLISRKDHRRSGMRFLVRGADSNGNVANFAETEQIVLVDEMEGLNILSYLQIRGSIPVSWKQEPDLQLNPKVSLDKLNAINYI